uniref:Venom polypeptide n=1 Tax=Dolopus genitalis TaxID=2488630 RepID=A0A3G5BIL1_DOLGE|nr:venom polypeptide [Dolopus genitalis]
MKITIFALFAVFAVCCASRADHDALKKDLKEFQILIPKASMALIIAKHLIFDSEFRKAKDFIGTPESNALGLNIMKSHPFREAVQDLRSKDIDAPTIINIFARLLKFPLYPEEFTDEIMIQPRSFNSFIDDVIYALPKNEFSKLMKHKVKTSPVFRKFYLTSISPEFNKRIEAILNYPLLRPTFVTFKSKGIDFRHIYSAVKTILSWGK